jgi:hypothetical protein
VLLLDRFHGNHLNMSYLTAIRYDDTLLNQGNVYVRPGNCEQYEVCGRGVVISIGHALHTLVALPLGRVSGFGSFAFAVRASSYASAGLCPTACLNMPYKCA